MLNKCVQTYIESLFDTLQKEKHWKYITFWPFTQFVTWIGSMLDIIFKVSHVLYISLRKPCQINLIFADSLQYPSN